jgi:hypothetical protein
MRLGGAPAGGWCAAESRRVGGALAEVRPMIETLPLERAAEAYERMMSGEARFGMVLTTGA